MINGNPQDLEPFEPDEMRALKEFARAMADGKLWLCRGYRLLAALGKLAGALMAIAAAGGAAWHLMRGAQ